MVRDGNAVPAPDGVPCDADADLDADRPDAAVAAPFTGGTTSGLTALDRARHGEIGAVRVLFVVGAAGDEPDAADHRLVLAAHIEGFATLAVTADEAEAALADGHHHAIVIDIGAVGGGAEALVARLGVAAPSIPIVVVGPDDARSAGWIDVGADDHLDAATVTPAVLSRAIESAIARGRARELRRRLEHADRLTTIGQIAAGVAHEVNNPAAFLLMNLRTCREYVGELRATVPDAGAGDGTPSASSALLDEMAEMLDDNVRGVERIVAIVEALRSYVRMDADQPQSIDVADVCRDAVALVASRLRQFARLELAIGDSACVNVDPRRLAQVIVNLLVNAGDACEIAERAPAGGHRITVSIERRGDRVAIIVTDTGVGITAPVRARMFEPFFTTKPRGRGTGLGLAIARDIVERCAGRLEVDSEPGRGTRFEIVLPVDRDAESGAVAPINDATAPRTRARLLIIDDEVPLTTALRRQLRHHHDIAVANAGASALALVEREPFDVVLCDVTMPEMDGLAVHAALARRHPRLASRVIFMSGGLFGDNTRDAIASAGVPVLGKPVAIDSLLEAIETARMR
jgi:signal transduction histidine kinase/CheY-like chemotaxis protein